MKRSWVRSAATLLLFGGFTLAATAQAPATPPPAGGDAVPHHERPHFPPKTGVQTAGVQHDIAELAPQATFSVEGHPDWMAVADDGVWVTSSSANHVVWLDAKTNQPGTIITVNKPCAGLALGFGSLWIPSCGDHTVVARHYGSDRHQWMGGGRASWIPGQFSGGTDSFSIGWRVCVRNGKHA